MGVREYLIRIGAQSPTRLLLIGEMSSDERSQM
jgi:hypothetical protein